MKIGITGDSHGQLQALRRLLQVVEPVDYWFHTGDFSQDSAFLQQETKLPTLAVAGNCDPLVGRANVDEFVTLLGKRIWLTHGNRYLHGPQGEEELIWWAHKLEADIVVFGHTHLPQVKWYGEVLLINPGSIAKPRSGNEPSYAVLNLQEQAKPVAKIINI